jgi:NhaD family Na+/H+ antiporter
MSNLDLTQSWFGYASLVIFVLSYILVIFEETLDLRKSKPVLIAAGLIWALIGLAYTAAGTPEITKKAAEHTIYEYGELLLFLLVAITYVNTLEERRVFDVLRGKLTSRGLSYRQLFWLTGFISFFLSGVLDNLTTALIMGSVVLAVGTNAPKFVAVTCVSIVVAANAGGAFTPFGDITTLMVWQKGKVTFIEFFALFLPSLVNWLVPAAFMHFGVPKTAPAPVEEKSRMKPGGLGVILLFALTIATAVSFKNFLGLQPALGMMLGLGYLQVWSYFLQQKGKRAANTDMVLNSFKQIERVEWDTLLFFFGIIFAVGGLGVLGYLNLTNQYLYAQWGPTYANVTVGILSAIVDNIPIMFAVLTMDPAMSHGQWLLVTLTAGVGGSLLSIGSAAGVALMGIAHGKYTFSSHFKWTWAVALGYFASIVVHLWLNTAYF